MSVIVVQIPPRRRQGPQAASSADAGAGAGATADSGTVNPPDQWFWVKTENGLTVQAQGRSKPADMPPSEAVVAVLSEVDVSWHRLQIPKAPPNKMRAALLGSLEDQVLTEPEQLHMALAPDAAPGEKAWVAVVDKDWLKQVLSQLERHGLMIDRVVPSVWPGERSVGYFYDLAPAGGKPEPALAIADANGIACIPLAGSLSRSLLPSGAIHAMTWYALSSVASAAERWLGEVVTPRSHAEQLIWSARSTWNLRQFDLVPRRRGSMALKDLMRRFMRPTWRPVRWGLVALLATVVVGLNLRAWTVEQTIEDRRKTQAQLLTQAHPNVRTVVNAPLQMERETDLLRALAGQPGAGDLETLLALASGAWPESQGPMQSLRFFTGNLSLGTQPWSPEELRQFSDRLKPTGWTVTSQNGRITLSRSAAP
jgi:general secretion pathway protein L